MFRTERREPTLQQQWENPNIHVPKETQKHLVAAQDHANELIKTYDLIEQLNLSEKPIDVEFLKQSLMLIMLSQLQGEHIRLSARAQEICEEVVNEPLTYAREFLTTSLTLLEKKNPENQKRYQAIEYVADEIIGKTMTSDGINLSQNSHVDSYAIQKDMLRWCNLIDVSDNIQLIGAPMHRTYPNGKA